MSSRPIPALSLTARAARRGEDRRAIDRRGRNRAWQRFDPLFAATLVNQIMPPELIEAHGYEHVETSPRCGIVVNVQA